MQPSTIKPYRDPYQQSARGQGAELAQLAAKAPPILDGVYSELGNLIESISGTALDLKDIADRMQCRVQGVPVANEANEKPACNDSSIAGRLEILQGLSMSLYRTKEDLMRFA